MEATGDGISGFLGGTALVSGSPHPLNLFLFSLAGLFVISLVSNATPFFGASYTVVAASELIAFGYSVEGFILVVLITAAGAVIGKLIIYGGVGAFKDRLSKNRNVQLLARWLQDSRFLAAVFVSGVIPLLPLDDYIYIGAGAARARLAPMLSVTLAAKLVKSAVEIELEFLGILRITSFTRHVLRISFFEFSILLTVAFIAIGIFLFKFDWRTFLGEFHERYPDQTRGSAQIGDRSDFTGCE
ncbi:MAG: VTT domain-containing protein [Nitrososphaerales archaeon]